MKRNNNHSYFAAGLTAFAVVAASLFLFFMLFHFSAVARFVSTLSAILRPIFMGAVIAFLLLPVGISSGSSWPSPRISGWRSGTAMRSSTLWPLCSA